MQHPRYAAVSSLAAVAWLMELLQALARFNRHDDVARYLAELPDRMVPLEYDAGSLQLTCAVKLRKLLQLSGHELPGEF